MAKILKPGDITVDQLTTDQKINLLVQFMQQQMGMLNNLAVAFFNVHPCGKCGTMPDSPIRCAKCMAEDTTEAQRQAIIQQSDA